MAQSPSSDTRFRRLFDEYETAMREYCSRRLGVQEANDAAAEVFLVAWRKIDQVPIGADARMWLYGVARNVVRNASRSARRRERLAAVFDVSAEAIDMRLSRARKRLAGALNSVGYTPEISRRPRAAEEGGSL